MSLSEEFDEWLSCALMAYEHRMPNIELIEHDDVFGSLKMSVDSFSLEVQCPADEDSMFVLEHAEADTMAEQTFLTTWIAEVNAWACNQVGMHVSLHNFLDMLLKLYLKQSSVVQQGTTLSKTFSIESNECWSEDIEMESWETAVENKDVLSLPDMVQYCLQTDLEFMTEEEERELERRMDISKSALDHRRSLFVFQEAHNASAAIASENNALSLDGLSVVPLYAAGAVKMSLELYDIEETEEVALNLLGLNADFPLNVLIVFDSFGMDGAGWTDQVIDKMDIQFWQRQKASSADSAAFDTVKENTSRSFCFQSYLPKLVRSFLTHFKQRIHELVDATATTTATQTPSKKLKRSVSKALKTLIGMGFGQKESTEALESVDNDLSKATDILLASRSATEQASSLISTGDFYIDLLLHLQQCLRNCTNYCVICSKRHEGDSARLRPCNNELCLFSFEEVGLGCNVFAEIQNNPELVNVDLTLASTAVASSRAVQIFEPFPSFCLRTREVRSRAGFFDNGTVKDGSNGSTGLDSNKDIGLLVNLFKTLPALAEIAQHVHSEAELRDFLRVVSGDYSSSNGVMAYQLIKFVLATNRLHLRHLKAADRMFGLPDGTHQFAILHNSPEKEACFQQLKATHGSFFVWHGSSFENWYSILRNGLRVLSNTRLMTAGAAYGSGIYVSPTTQVSWGYSSRVQSTKPAWNHSQFAPGTLAIAICEVIDNGQTVKNSNQIWVVPKEDCITLRYFIVCDPSSHGRMASIDIGSLPVQSHFNGLIQSQSDSAGNSERVQHRKLLKEQRAARRKEHRQQKTVTTSATVVSVDEDDQPLEKLADRFIGQGSRAATLVLMREMRKILRQQKSPSSQSFYTVEFEEENCYRWKVSLNGSGFGDCTLAEDLKVYASRYNQKPEVLLDVLFPANFPFEPPFVRVVRPRFAFHTGHVTVGGSICMELLTNSGWSPGYSVESVLVQIQADMIVGGGRLDLAQCGRDYSMEEAKEAFARVARAHGWKV
eukprot:GILJ01008009.1.p1 GENE.GILJ01008009.1~~GILJ01008009.1.p1  ORF type:complete len:1020 (-),score=161.50 GILJ01008009.1:314-3328(-)